MNKLREMVWEWWCQWPEGQGLELSVALASFCQFTREMDFDFADFNAEGLVTTFCLTLKNPALLTQAGKANVSQSFKNDMTC